MTETTASWCVYRSSFDVDSFLRRYPMLQPDEVWRVGERRTKLTVHQTSGFSKRAGDGEIDVVIESALRLLREHREALVVLREMDVESFIDIALYLPVGGDLSAASVLQHSQLTAFAELAVGVQISTYACSDDDWQLQSVRRLPRPQVSNCIAQHHSIDSS